jgi:amidase
MSFKMPSTDQVRAVGDHLGIDVTEDYANSFINFIKPFSEGYRLLASLPDDVPAIKHLRGAYYRPEGDENKYGAWIAKTHIKGASSGKLAGKKVAVKDTYAVAGVPLTNGASILEGLVPEFDATVVTRLLDAGAEIVGKSVCEYFSFSGGAATSTTGPVHNPRAWGHTPGGSSTGSGALVAAGEVDMATGGDQAGSIRIPASLSGVVGIKPTWGLVPYTGIMGMDPTIDHAGPLTATAAENALFLEVMAGDDGYDSRQRGLKVDSYTKAIGQGITGLKIGVVQEGFGQYDSHPDVDAGVRAGGQSAGRDRRRGRRNFHSLASGRNSDLVGDRARGDAACDGDKHAAAQHRRRLPALDRGTARLAARSRQRTARHREGRHAARVLHRQILSGLFLLQGAKSAPPAARGL